METEQIYQLILLFLDYISPKDKDNAMPVLLNQLYEADVDLIELQKIAESDDDQWFAKQIKIFIRENGILDIEEDEDW